MKNAFNLKTVALFLSLGFFAASCDKDKDDVVPTPDNTEKGNTEYDGEKYNVKNGYYIDGGGLGLFGGENTHYLDFLFMTDGTPTFDNGGEITQLEDGKIVILAPMFSAGGSEFKGGTFHYSDLERDEELGDEAFIKKYTNRSFFYQPVVVIDTDGDGDWEDEDELEINGGTIKVSGNIPNITTEYDLQLTNGKTLKGKYAGKFNKLEVEEEEEGEFKTLSEMNTQKRMKW